ncbi:MAG: hypothetical protein IAE77_05350 [Prosthecobacter sp.]|uniref:tetratricopeptide repeat protein n=1 Tax=Prosthecobacter sp. TaxID=1965333 RepID=UPI001A088510|nr:tetratricopeptide repeat protein [Prosthecobacter sp.]MBE2282869.1 hypothetical protein [Prosthecobacter sp.]
MKRHFALLCLTPLIHAASLQEQADAFFARGEAAEKRGDTQLAEVCYQLALRAQPGHFGAMEHLQKMSPAAFSASTNPQVAGKWVYPRVQFQSATLDEAVEFLRVRSRDIDPRGIGVDIIQAAPSSQASISLDLLQVPLEDTVRYCVELCGLAWRWENGRILITPKDQAGKPLPEVPIASGAPDLAAWRLPKLTFSAARLPEVMDFFTRASTSADPFSKGIRHAFHDAQGKPVDAKAFSQATLSLELHHISAHEALRYITLLSGAVIRVEKDQVILQPAGAVPQLHHWTNTAGATVAAAFVRLDGDSVVIQRDGKEFTIPLAKLDPASRELAKKLSAP